MIEIKTRRAASFFRNSPSRLKPIEVEFIWLRLGNNYALIRTSRDARILINTAFITWINCACEMSCWWNAGSVISWIFHGIPVNEQSWCICSATNALGEVYYYNDRNMVFIGSNSEFDLKFHRLGLENHLLLVRPSRQVRMLFNMGMIVSIPYMCRDDYLGELYTGYQ